MTGSGFIWCCGDCETDRFLYCICKSFMSLRDCAVLTLVRICATSATSSSPCSHRLESSTVTGWMVGGLTSTMTTCLATLVEVGFNNHLLISRYMSELFPEPPGPMNID